jgi:prolipoprotein diacylglyceryltransferase
MYPNLYYVFQDWFGLEWHALSFLNCFGLMVAIAFVVAAWVITSELKRKEKQGLLLPREEIITVGRSASPSEIFVNALTGFIFGYKLIGLFFFKPENLNAQEYIFTTQGSLLGGILGASLIGGLKWWDKRKERLPTPEKRNVRIWPHDRVGDIIILGLVFGILGAKLFDNLENWDEFVKHPLESIFSASGLTFYGGLILATIAICWYGLKKGIKLKHLVDSAAPALMIAYAIGRIGCHVSGDGDWGIYNSSYTSDEYGKVSKTAPQDFQVTLNKYSTYFLEGKVVDNGSTHFVTDRTYPSLTQVPHKSIQGPAFLPGWLFAYAYPNNVNKDGILIPGDTREHNRVLPQPVFPTSLYEFIICSLLFLLMWSIRKKITVPLLMFGIYLCLNGVERFFIETMRVNKTYPVLGYHASQAELIAILLVLIGLGIIIYSKRSNSDVD